MAKLFQFLSKFNGKNTVSSTSTAPKALYNEQAIDYLVNPLFQMQDTDETLKKLGVHRKELRALEGDDEITACIETRREALIATPWRLELGKARVNNFIWQELDRVIVSVLRGAFNAVLYGYSVQEIIWQQLPDGKIGLKEVSEKPFEWFEPKSDGRLIYRSQLNPQGEAIDKKFKFLLSIRNETYRQPYGEALLSRLYWAWLFRVNGWKYWAKNLERAGTPFLVGTAPNETLPDGTTAVDYLTTVLNSAVSNATLALPDGWTAQFLSATQTGTSFEQFEQAILKRIQKVILGQTLTSDVGKTGSFAAAKVHENVLSDRKIADIRLATKTVQTLVNALHTLNGFTGEPPTFVMEDDTGLEVERADRDSKLVQAGVLKLTPDYLLRVYDYEDGDFEIPNNVPPDKNTPMGVNKPSNFSASNELSKFTPDQQIIEDLADNVLEKLSSPIPEGAIFNAIKAAKDYDDLADRLAVLFVETDTAEFRTVLERATFAADCLGYANA
jgi:phage gp29-like protein